MLHPAQGIVRRDRSYGLGDSRVESFSSTSLQAPQDSFDLGPAFFDGVEIGRIRGQIQQAGAGGLDFFLYGRCFVGAQVVQDHDLSRLQFRAQDLIEKSQKHIGIGRIFDRHGGQQTGTGHGSQQSEAAPMAGGNGFGDLFSLFRSAPVTAHLGVEPGFVNKHPLPLFDLTYFLLIRLPLLLDPWRVLLLGIDRLFLRRNPIFRSTVQRET